jgi:hypothetical protein
MHFIFTVTTFIQHALSFQLSGFFVQANRFFFFLHTTSQSVMAGMDG